jgi:hypothetical protein
MVCGTPLSRISKSAARRPPTDWPIPNRKSDLHQIGFRVQNHRVWSVRVAVDGDLLRRRLRPEREQVESEEGHSTGGGRHNYPTNAS